MSLAELEYLRTVKLGACSRCPLCNDRTWIVFGAGDPEADIVFIGEAPGFHEDFDGKPFRGDSGDLLDKSLVRVGLQREDVYVTNIIKCRPPNNRDPEDLEIAKCSPFLHAQLGIIKPKVIVTLGRFAGNLITGQQVKRSMRALAGMNPWTYTHPVLGIDTPVIALYHPSYLLRQLSNKEQAAPLFRDFVLGIKSAKDIAEGVVDDLLEGVL